MKGPRSFVEHHLFPLDEKGSERGFTGDLLPVGGWQALVALQWLISAVSRQEADGRFRGPCL